MSEIKMCANEEMAIDILEFIKRNYEKHSEEAGVQKYIEALEMGIDGDNEHYVKCFNEQVLSKLNAKQVFAELIEMTPSDITFPNIVLMCYEKPGDFCHRHLVSEWFNANGIQCKELLI